MNLLIFLLCIVVAVSAGFKKENGVLVLGEDDFDAAINAHDYVLAEFYAPWCGHCKTLAPEFAKAAKALAKKKNIALAKIDATVHGKLSDRYGVKGFPTLKWFKKDSRHAREYTGGRNEPGISSWVLKNTVPAISELDDVGAAKVFRDEADVAVIGYFSKMHEPHLSNSDEEPSTKEIFTKVANSFDGQGDPIFGITSNADVAKSLDLEDGGITLFKKFDEALSKWDGKTDLIHFVKTNKIAYVTEFSDETAPGIFGGEAKLFGVCFLFSGESSPDFSRHMQAFTESAKSHRDTVRYVYVDCDKSKNERILEFFGSKEDACAAIRMLKLGSKMPKFRPNNDDLSKSGIDGFVDGVLDESIERHLRSEAVPESKDGGIYYLVGSEFDKVVKENRDRAVLVMFYAPWCGHCKKLSPIWEQLNDSFKNNNKLLIATSDATRNDFDDIEVKTFPTIKYFPKGQYRVIDYYGERDLKSFEKFIETWIEKESKEFSVFSQLSLLAVILLLSAGLTKLYMDRSLPLVDLDWRQLVCFWRWQCFWQVAEEEKSKVADVKKVDGDDK